MGFLATLQAASKNAAELAEIKSQLRLDALEREEQRRTEEDRVKRNYYLAQGVEATMQALQERLSRAGMATSEGLAQRGLDKSEMAHPRIGSPGLAATVRESNYGVYN